MENIKKEFPRPVEAEEQKMSIGDRGKGNEKNIKVSTALPDSEYIRVGTQYFRNTEVPQWIGKEVCLVRRLTPWTKEAIK